MDPMVSRKRDFSGLAQTAESRALLTPVPKPLQLVHLPSPDKTSHLRAAYISLAYSGVGLFLWLKPWVGLPVGAIALYWALRSTRTPRTGRPLPGRIGVGLSLVVLMLSVINAVMGYCFGASGVNPLTRIFY